MWYKTEFISHYSSLQCLADLLLMLETIVLLNIFGNLFQLFSGFYKDQHLFKIEIFCNFIHYRSEVRGQNSFFFLWKKKNNCINQGCVKLISDSSKDLHC